MTDEQRREPDVTHVEVVDVDVVEIDVTVTELVDGELVDGELGDPDDAGHASALGAAHAATSIVAGEAFEAADPDPADLDGDVIDVIDVIDEGEEVELVDERDGDDGEHDAVLVLDTWQIELPATGDATVDAALARLAEVEGLPTTEHANVYEAVHARLQDALADLDRS